MLAISDRRIETDTARSVYNVVNVFVSLGLLSKPYALQHGGWISLLMLAVLTCASWFTSHLMLDCFKLIGKPTTYHELGQIAAGKIGQTAAAIFVTTELYVLSLPVSPCHVSSTCHPLMYSFGALVITIVFYWKSVILLLVDLPVIPTIILSTAAVMPTVWLHNFRELWLVSLLGVICTLIIVLITLQSFLISIFSIAKESAAANDPVHLRVKVAFEQLCHTSSLHI
jgi:hypothetical protein